MSTTYLAKALEDLEFICSKIIQDYPYERVFLLEGAMGVGKTSLAKHLCKALGSTDDITSPTFSILNEYSSNYGDIYHFDFYRINHESEAFDIGFEEYVYSGNYCFIEWSEKIINLLPQSYTIIHINEIEDQARLIELVANHPL